MKKEMGLALASLMLSSSLLAQTYEVEAGWSLLGANDVISTSDILNNEEIENIVIYNKGTYQFTSNNDFTVIQANKGFWVYATQATTVDTTPEEFRKLNTSLLKVEEGELWSILNINSLNLRLEIKTTQESADTKYTIEDGRAYCASLTLGGLTGWRLPTQKEFTSITASYEGNEEYFSNFNESGEKRYMVLESSSLYEERLTNEYTNYNTLNSGLINGSGWVEGLSVMCVKTKL